VVGFSKGNKVKAGGLPIRARMARLGCSANINSLVFPPANQYKKLSKSYCVIPSVANLKVILLGLK